MAPLWRSGSPASGETRTGATKITVRSWSWLSWIVTAILLTWMPVELVHWVMHSPSTTAPWRQKLMRVSGCMGLQSRLAMSWSSHTLLATLPSRCPPHSWRAMTTPLHQDTSDRSTLPLSKRAVLLRPHLGSWKEDSEFWWTISSTTPTSPKRSLSCAVLWITFASAPSASSRTAGWLLSKMRKTKFLMKMKHLMLTVLPWCAFLWQSMCMHTPHINDHVKAVDGKLTLRRNEQERGRLIEYMKRKKNSGMRSWLHWIVSLYIIDLLLSYACVHCHLIHILLRYCRLLK